MFYLVNSLPIDSVCPFIAISLQSKSDVLAHNLSSYSLLDDIQESLWYQRKQTSFFVSKTSKNWKA